MRNGRAISWLSLILDVQSMKNEELTLIPLLCRRRSRGLVEPLVMCQISQHFHRFHKLPLSKLEGIFLLYVLWG